VSTMQARTLDAMTWRQCEVRAARRWRLEDLVFICDRNKKEGVRSLRRQTQEGKGGGQGSPWETTRAKLQSAAALAQGVRAGEERRAG
jgi:hypothetical protein